MELSEKEIKLLVLLYRYALFYEHDAKWQEGKEERIKKSNG